MKKTLLVLTIGATIALTALICLTDGYTNFYNITTGDNGVSFILKGKVYDAAAKMACALKQDERGGLKDVKIPLTKQTYIVFEVE